jgi:hypothetical protein
MAKADVIAEIGIEVTEFRSSMAKAVESIDATTAATNKLEKATKEAQKSQVAGSAAVQKAASKTAYQTGQVAMQLQDVAVQAQMGTGALQIFAQQGSQVASVFGGMKGAIVGGALAIGATLVSAGVESEKAFSNIIKGANDLENELSGVAANGSLNAVVRGFEMSAESVGKLTEEVQSLGGFWRGLWEDSKALVTLGYTDTQLQKIAKTEKEILDSQELSDKLMERFKVVSAESVHIAKLRASGETDTADALQRQLDLKLKLEAIDASKGSPEAKVRQKDLERELAKQKEIEIAKKKQDEKEKARDEHDRKQKEDLYKFQESEEKKAAEADDKYFDQRKRNDQEINEINNAFRKQQEQRDKEAADEQMKLQEAAGKLLREWNDEETDARNKRIERNKANKESLADAIRETQIMNAQTRGSDLQSKLLRSKLETEKKIAEARKAGNEELVRQLQIQRQITDLDIRVNERLKTPQQRREEREAQRDRDKAERAVIRRQRAINAGRAVLKKGEAVGVIPAAPNMQPQAPAAGGPNVANAGGNGNAMKVETLIVGTLKHK